MIDNIESKAVKKPKRTNKNKKKSWRKHIDISTIEDALDEQRLELRTGGLLSHKKDSELFFIDKSHTAGHIPKSRKNKRLRVDQIIVPDPTAIKLPEKTRRRVKRQATRTLEKKLVRRVNAAGPDSKDEVGLYDLWANESIELRDKFEKKSEAGKHTEKIIGKRQIKRPKNINKKASDAQTYKYHGTPAVEVAHPGASYNPTFDDHQELLAKAHQVEVKKMRAKERVDNALHVPYESLPELGEREREMQEGLFENGTDGEETEEADDTVVTANAPVRAADKKTRRKRRIEEREKLEKREKEAKWADKLRENEVFRTKTFLAEIKAKEKKHAARRDMRKKKQRLVTLSNVKFTEQDLEIKLTDELKGSLRELKPEAGLLTDRYKSLQKRGIVEPRCKRRVPKRKRKVKYQEKRQWREIQ